MKREAGVRLTPSRDLESSCLQVTVFRGCQFDRLDYILESCEPVFKGPAQQKRRTHPDVTHTELASALSSVLLRLLKAEVAGTGSTMPEVKQCVHPVRKRVYFWLRNGQWQTITSLIKLM